MKVYFWDFINFKQNDWASLLPMAEFAYNNVNNTNIGHMLFKLNCSYHRHILFKKNVNP